MKRFSFFPCLLFLSFVTACDGDGEWGTLRGGFLVSLGDEAATAASRAVPAEIGKPVAGNFNLTVTSRRTGTAIYDAPYTSGFIPAAAGTYSLTATCGVNPVLAWDSPYYKGSTEAEVTTDSATSVTLACSVANSLLSVKFVNPEQFAGLYSSYHVRVKVENLSLDIGNGDVEKSAYFRAGSAVGLEFHAELKDNGRKVSMEIEDTRLSGISGAGMHTVLSLKAATPTSGAILTVDKVETEKVTVAETIPMEWLPRPKVTGFSGSNTLTYTETADAPPEAAIGYTASFPVQDVELTLDFKDAQYTEYNGSYTLSAMTDGERAALGGIGIGLPAIDGVSLEGKIDLGALTPNLRTDSGSEVTNTVRVNVKANNRWSSETGEDYKIRVIKPEFSVSVQPENMWSREFTADGITVTTGNAEKIRNSLTYQYSPDGGATWNGCSDGPTQKFPTHPDNKDYKVRACYRGCIYSNNMADVTLETPVQLPNSDMETWNTVEGETFRVSDSWGKKATYHHFYPYSAGTTDSWWTTNNDRSQDGSIVLGLGHPVAFAPCVSYNEGNRHGGNRSALIYTSGHGGGYASTGEIIYSDGAIAGTLFIGTYEWNDKTERVTAGHPFTVRPTEFSFWYKYVPKGNDRFKAHIELRNGDDIIAEGTFIPAAYSEADSDFRQAVVQLSYTDNPGKATSVYVQFLSTTKTSFSSGDFDKDKSFTFPVMGNWNVHMGSMLYIDDLSLSFTK